MQKTLRRRGIFVLCLDHPFRSLGNWDLKKDKYFIDNYFNRGENEWDYVFPEENVSGRFRGACWTLGDLVTGFLDSGFKIDKLLEPEPVKREEYPDRFGASSRYGTNHRQDPFNFENLKRIPGTIIIRGIKE